MRSKQMVLDGSTVQVGIHPSKRQDWPVHPRAPRPSAKARALCLPPLPLREARGQGPPSRALSLLGLTKPWLASCSSQGHDIMCRSTYRYRLYICDAGACRRSAGGGGRRCRSGPSRIRYKNRTRYIPSWRVDLFRASGLWLFFFAFFSFSFSFFSDFSLSLRCWLRDSSCASGLA